MLGVSLVVQKSEWDAFLARTNPWLVQLLGKSFYAAGVFWCLHMTVASFEEKRKIGMIRYVFERGPGQGEAHTMLEEMRAEPADRDKYRIAGFSFEDKSDPEFVPLQAADFLAYESYRQIDNQIFGRGEKLTAEGKRISMRGAMRCLIRADDPVYGNIEPHKLPQCPHSVIWLDRAGIEYYSRNLQTDLKRMGIRL